MRAVKGKDTKPELILRRKVRAIAPGYRLNRRDIPGSVPHAAMLRRALPPVMGNGGSCIAGPDGEWIVPPVTGREALVVREITHRRVLEERQNSAADDDASSRAV